MIRIRSINCIRTFTHSPLVRNLLDLPRKNFYRNKNKQQQICKDENNETLSDRQESSCPVKSSIFFNSQKRNDIDMPIENTLSKSPAPTK